MTQKSDGLINVRDELFNTYQTQLDIPINTLNRADNILDQAVAADQTHSRCYKTIMAAVTLLACRETNTPRVASDFGDVTIKDGTPLTENEIRNEYRRLKRELNLTPSPIDAETHLEYYANELGVTEETRSTAQQLLETAQSNGMTNGPAPTSLAAGVLDAARRLTDDEIVQTDIAKVSHVSKNQFREYCQELMTQPTA